MSGRTSYLVALALFLCGAGASASLLHRTSPPAVSAEEEGIQVSLAYMRGYSTWGPTNAYGSAMIWPHEGVARLTVHKLPHLLGGDSYVWWVVSTLSGAALRLGTFNTSEAGDGQVDTFLNASLPSDANVLVVSVALRGDALSRPGVERTLSGYIARRGPGPSLAQPQPLGSGHGSGSQAHGAGGSGGSAHGGTAKATAGRTLPVHVVSLPQTGGGPGAAGGHR